MPADGVNWIKWAKTWIGPMLTGHVSDKLGKGVNTVHKGLSEHGRVNLDKDKLKMHQKRISRDGNGYIKQLKDLLLGWRFDKLDRGGIH